MINTPVLFLTYKRFETSEKVFNSIKKAQPRKLYFVSNAPKTFDEEEITKVSKVRSLIHQIDWKCEVVTLFREVYLDVQESISNSIDWFFTQEEMGIILEDDCVPSQSFYEFCEEMLKYYKYDERVYSVGGCCFLEDPIHSENEYMFSNHTYIWGWATWRRAWLQYDLHMTEWPEYKKSKEFKSLFTNYLVRYYWSDLFDKVYLKELKTWDYQWLYSIWKNKGYSIIPNRNLVTNIGFGIDSNFTHDQSSIEANIKSKEILPPFTYQSNTNFNVEEQKFVEKYVYKINTLNVLVNLLYKLFVKIFK